MDINNEDIKTFSQIAKPLIDPIINSLIKPHIDRLNAWISKNDKQQKVQDNFWENKFENYLQILYKDSLFLTTLVFPNSQTKIKDLYVPLTLTQANDSKKIRIQTFDYSLFDSYSKIIISDYAGMGKSTVVKWITISIIEQQKGIPILVELRKIDEKNSLTDEIFNQLSPADKTLDKELVFELLELGCFTILLDGFDEIPYDIQDKVTIQISDFVKKTAKNNFILTSRPESALSSFPNFQLFHIDPLEDKEAYALINKLDALSKVKFGKKLITEIKEKNTQVKEFLSNPFLVSLLYKSYTYNKDIPSKKITFYEEVYSCLFKHHDLSKEGFKRPKRSRLDIFDFEIILRDIAFETSKIGRVIYSKDELIAYILGAKERNSRIEFKEQNFYDDLTTTVPIFTVEGQKIKWAHKSIQDFFSAKYISNHSRKAEIIDVLFRSKKFHYLNILDLLYELEYKIFRKVIIRSILVEFVQYHDSQFKTKPPVSQGLVDERIGLMFGARFCLIKTDEEIGFEQAREMFRLAVAADVDTFSAGATFHHANPPYYTMNESSVTKQLLKILRIKNEDLFIELDQPEAYLFQEDAFYSLDFNKAYVIDDDLSAPYNSAELFDTINSEIRNRLRDHRDRVNLTFNLDYRKAIAQVIVIDREIKNDESLDLLANI